jgi:LDH2 family malate/lactate/ureidoglycolate dehydrogenase
MAVYPGTETEKRIPVVLLKGTVKSIFTSVGMLDEDAALMADCLVGADQRGVHSHGTAIIQNYVGKVAGGGVDPRGRPRLTVDNGAAMVVDAANSMGQISMTFAMQQAIDRARTTGVALAAIGGSNHSGTMHPYVTMAARQGMIGICGTNAIPTMAPWGGGDQIVGINPIGIAIPGTKGNFVLDFALGATAHGKIRVYAQKKSPIPDDWAFDAAGNRTTDPIAAMKGLIQPIGKYKGVALAMAVGMLSTVLSGAAYGTELGTMATGPQPGKDGHFCMAINIAMFQPLDQVKARVDRILSQVQDSSRARGVDRLCTPGLAGDELEVAYARDGIPLNDETLAGIVAAGQKVGADVAALMKIVEDKIV